MNIWAIADLHLAFGAPTKTMEVFGDKWVGYADKIEKNWKSVVGVHDLVLIAGDISWAMRLNEAAKDLGWIDKLPGTKVMIRGNHDYWWGSASKVRKALPPSIQIVQHDAFLWQDTAIGGTRLWDSAEYSFDALINFTPRPNAKMPAPLSKEDTKIFERELLRLEMSLKAMDPSAKRKIFMTHYPPISHDLKSSRVSKLFDQYHIDVALFGHLHNVKEASSIFGKKNDVTYHLTSADYLNFTPLKIF